MNRINDRLARAKKENKENHTVLGWRITYEQDITTLKQQLADAEMKASRMVSSARISSQLRDVEYKRNAKLQTTITETQAELGRAKDLQKWYEGEILRLETVKEKYKATNTTQAEEIASLEKTLGSIGNREDYVEQAESNKLKLTTLAKEIKKLRGTLEKIKDTAWDYTSPPILKKVRVFADIIYGLAEQTDTKTDKENKPNDSQQ